MVLPIIFNLQRWRRMEGWGLRLVDRLTETKTGREMKGEKFENGRDKKNQKNRPSNYKRQRQSYQTDKEDAFIASKPRFSLS